MIELLFLSVNYQYPYNFYGTSSKLYDYYKVVNDK